MLLNWVYSSGWAQLCQGSLGDPVINITFGSGSNPGVALQAASTSYSFVTTDCPSDGFYTVRNNSSACFGNSWHSIGADHTGDGSGYFMLVNASIDPGAFYVDTVRGLCGNTTFEFAAWVMNMLLPSSCSGAGTMPNLTFTIELPNGTVLQSYNSGNIPQTNSPIWNQYGFFFNTPSPAGDLVLRIVNNAPGGCGNDLALDDITFRPCGSLVTGTINGGPIADQHLCTYDNRNYLLTCSAGAGFRNPAYQWQRRVPGQSVWTDVPGQTSRQFNFDFHAPVQAGMYEARLAVAEAGNMSTTLCRVYSPVFRFEVHNKPVVTIQTQPPYCSGKAGVLKADGADSYSWQGPGGLSATGNAWVINPMQLIQTGTYTVQGTDLFGCQASAQTQIQVIATPQAAVTQPVQLICEGRSVRLSGSGTGTYQWNPSTGLSDPSLPNPVASPAADTYYLLTVEQNGCTDTAGTMVRVLPAPMVDAGPDRVLLTGESVILSGAVNHSEFSIEWSPGFSLSRSDILQPVARPEEDQQYIIRAYSSNGCGEDRDTVLVKVYRDIFIPAAFSPNNDGLNDQWVIPSLAAFPSFDLQVYDRWGRQVFQQFTAGNWWNGRYLGEPLPSGIYIYLLRLPGRTRMYKGTVVIIH